MRTRALATLVMLLGATAPAASGALPSDDPALVPGVDAGGTVARPCAAEHGMPAGRDVGHRGAGREINGLLLAQAPLRIEVHAGRSVSAATVAHVRDLAERSTRRLRGFFPGIGLDGAAIVVHRDPGSMPPDLRSSLHPGTAGLALLGRQEVHLLLDRARQSPPHDLGTVVEHELVHLLLHRYAGPGAGHLPRWLHEGLAQHLTGVAYLGTSEEDIVWRAPAGGLPPISTLAEGFPAGETALRVAYAQSFSFVSWLSQHVGLDAILAATRRCSSETDYAEALRAETGRALAYLEHDWLEYLQHGSGAAFRALLGSCFGLLMVAALPLLVLAGARRLNRDLLTRQRLERQQTQEEPPVTGPENAP